MQKIFFFFVSVFCSLAVLAGNTKLELKVSGMHCGGCENKFKTAATQIKGIQEVTSVSAANGTATIVYDPAVITAEKAVQTLAENTGYTVTATTSMGTVQSEGHPAGCCQKGQSSAACKKTQKSCTSDKKDSNP